MAQHDDVCDELTEPMLLQEVRDAVDAADEDVPLSHVPELLTRLLESGRIQVIPTLVEGQGPQRLYWRYDTLDDLVAAVDRAGVVPLEHLEAYRAAREQGQAPDPGTPVERVDDEQLYPIFEEIWQGDAGVGFQQLDSLLHYYRRPADRKTLDAIREYLEKDRYKRHWSQVLTILLSVLSSPQCDWERRAQEDLLEDAIEVLRDRSAPVRARGSAYRVLESLADAERASEVFSDVLKTEICNRGDFAEAREGGNVLSMMCEKLATGDRQELLANLRQERKKQSQADWLDDWIRQLTQARDAARREI